MENLTDDMDKLYPFAFFLHLFIFSLQNNYEQKKNNYLCREMATISLAINTT